MEKVIITDIDQRIATLSPAKRALLERYLQDQNTAPALSVAKRDPSAPLPLSFAQQRLWFLEQLQPGLTAYNNVSAMRLNGRLNVQVLQQSLSEILRRHESMRTTFTSINGEPQQVINPPTPFPLPLEDFSQLPTSQWETEIEQCVSAENQRPFNLAQDLMRRARLLRFGEEEHVLILTGHHIASDGWSSAVFWRELMTLYKAFLQGEQTPLPALPIQYADYASWQRQRLQNANLERLQDYWKTRLTDVPPLLQLPTDFPRPTAATFRGDRIHFQFSPTLTKALRALSRQGNTTLYMTLLAAFQTLLYRYTGSDDILVGTPTANRPLPELESLIGFFVNTLPLRTDLAGNPSFLELLQRVRQIALDAFAHQELPFERIVEKLQVERNLAYNPLVQVIFSLQNMPRTNFELPDLQVSQLSLPSQNVHFDLQMLMYEVGDQLEGNCLYRTDLFEPATIQRLIHSFEQLLTGIVAVPSRRIDEFDLLNQTGKAQLLVAWNATETPLPSQGHLHQNIEAQATQTPTALAVVCNGQQLTYRQLNEQANQLAHYLIAQGVQPQMPIALCVERSLAMIIGILAILKAGGAYVPLEPTHPAERLKQMCDDIQATIVLTNSQLAPHFAAPNRQIVPVDQAWSTISQHGTQNPALDLPLDQLAYVLYTSGSTGKPKGVMIEHRQVTNYVTAMLGELIPPGSSCAMLQPLTVDSSLTMLFPPLFSGGVLHLLTQEQALDARAISDYFRNHTIDCLKIAPSHLAALQAIVDPAQLMPKRRLIIGGEASHWAWVKSLQAIAPEGCQVFNHYGPTETTVGVLTYQFPKASDAPLPALAKSPPVMTPLGHPIANTQIYILDDHLHPVPIGVEGELYIGGHNVGRGYLNRAELTAERFVPNPFSNGRLYRTGDRARYLPSGDVEFLGRLDGQVKLRGFRIELGEIEATLARHPAVRMAAVTLQAVSAEDQRLVAYVVAATEHAAQTELSEHLRSFLEEQLPAYMIPSAYVLLEALPRTAHGKLDRAALPEPPVNLATPGRKLQAARDPLELQLIRLWETLLGKHPISIQDNFFDLGGHSLLAVQLFDRIAKLTGKNLPLAVLFQSPTIEQLAAILRQENWTPSWKSIVPAQPGGTNPPLFLMPPGATTVLNFANLVRHMPAEQPIYGLQYVGMGEDGQPHESVEEMASYYVEQIVKFQPEGPYLVGGLCFGAHVALEIAQQLQSQGKTVALLVLLDTTPPVNGPTWHNPSRFTSAYFRMMADIWQNEGVKTWLRRRLKYRYTRLRNFLNPQKKYFEDVLAIHNKANITYCARPYNGRTLLIQSEEYRRFKHFNGRWAALATGIFEHVVIAGSTHRSVLLHGSDIQRTAQQLMSSINKALEHTR